MYAFPGFTIEMTQHFTHSTSNIETLTFQGPGYTGKQVSYRMVSDTQAYA